MRREAGFTLQGQQVAAWAAALAFGVATLQPLANSDTFGQMAAGREIAQLGYVPSVDHFSIWFGAPHPWRNHNWLSSLVLFALYSKLGPNGPVLASVAVAAASAWLLVWCMRNGPSGAAWTTALLLIAAIPAVRMRLSPRPHVASLLFEAVLLLALHELSARPSARPRVSWLLALGAMQVAWLNTHGSSLFGVALTVGYLIAYLRVAEVRRELACLLGLQALASCASPWGPSLLLEAVKHVEDPAVGAMLTEWAPFGASDPPWYLGALIVQGLLLALVARSLLRLGPSGLAMLGVAAVTWLMAMRSSRFILDALCLGAPAVALGLCWVTAPLTRGARRALGVTCGAAALIVAPIASARLPPFLPVGLGVDTSAIPWASGEWLRRYHPQARIVGAIQDSWYLSFAVPKSRVLIDGRIAVYGPKVMGEVLGAFRSRPAFRRLCDERRIDAAVLRIGLLGHREAMAELHAAPGFRLVALEDHHALFVRSWVAPEVPAFVRLEPSYAAQAPIEASAELVRIADLQAARGYYSYHAALDLLRPALRNRGLDGLTRGVADSSRLVRALSLLRIAAERMPEVPLTHVYHALVAAHACRLAEARQALKSARDAGDSRETLLIAQEIALRAHDDDSVRRFLADFAKLRSPAADAWVEALAREVKAPPRCD